MLSLDPLPPAQWPIAGNSPPRVEYMKYLQLLDRVVRALLAQPPNVQTANYILALTDITGLVAMNLAGANTLTVPANASVPLPVGFRSRVLQMGAGQTTLTPAVGVTLTARVGLKTAGQWAMGFLEQIAANTWVAYGDLAP